jgi:hypothetical protein
MQLRASAVEKTMWVPALYASLGVSMGVKRPRVSREAATRRAAMRERSGVEM